MSPIAITLILLVVAVILFATEKIPVDIVALLLVMALVLTQVLTVQQAVAGFGNDIIITIGGLFVLVGGLAKTGVVDLIGRRMHVDIDYDTERDFNARNNIQLYYEGLEDEVVRRVEVGTVTFRPPASRFLTASIPANNFGVNATFEIGALSLQGIAATQKGSVVAELSLQRNRSLSVSGPLGDTIVEVKNQQVRIARDPSPRQICVRHGWLSKIGEIALCLPNQVSVEIGNARGHVDSLNY